MESGPSYRRLGDICGYAGVMYPTLSRGTFEFDHIGVVGSKVYSVRSGYKLLVTPSM